MASEADGPGPTPALTRADCVRFLEQLSDRLEAIGYVAEDPGLDAAATAAVLREVADRLTSPPLLREPTRVVVAHDRLRATAWADVEWADEGSSARLRFHSIVGAPGGRRMVAELGGQVLHVPWL